MAEMTELLSCPFCGNTNKLVVRPYRADDDGGEPFDWGFTVICNASGFQHNPNRGCGASGAWGETEVEAIVEWNRRTHQQPFHSLSRNEDTSAVRPDQTGDEK